MQCRFDGVTVRMACAVMAPMAPLLLLLGCVVLETFSRGSGIKVGLQAGRHMASPTHTIYAEKNRTAQKSGVSL